MSALPSPTVIDGEAVYVLETEAQVAAAIAQNAPFTAPAEVAARFGLVEDAPEEVLTPEDLLPKPPGQKPGADGGLA